MRPMRLFWGLVIALVGIALLGANLGWWAPTVWSNLWHLWPLIFIALGLRAIFRDGAFFVSMVLLLVVAVLLMTGGVHYQTEHFSFSKSWSFNSGSVEKADFSQQMTANPSSDTLNIDLGGNYNIDVYGNDDNVVSVNLNGPKDEIDNLVFDRSGNTITLRDRDTSFGMHFMMGAWDQTTGTINIPRSLANKLQLSGLANLEYHNYQGKLTMDSSGASQVGFSNSTVTDPTVSLSGAGKVSFDQCQGSANFDMSGAGKITAAQCTLSLLGIKLSGAGEIDIKSGSITDLNVKTSGASKVKVPKPSGTVQQDNSGASNVSFY